MGPILTIKMAGPNLKFGDFEIPWTPAVRPEDENNMHPYKKREPGSRTLSTGWTFAAGRRPVSEEMIFDEMVEIPLRDGVKVSSIRNMSQKHADVSV